MNHNTSKSGQAIIFLVMVLVIGTLALLWNFDLHNITSTKLRVTNAGDAAALSAARWQAITLNMVGELNLIQAAYVCDNLVDISDEVQREDAQAYAYELRDLRSRLALNGPLVGLIAAQAAGLQNLSARDQERIEDNASSYIRQRGQDFVDSGGFYQGVVDEPYDGAWEEYGNLLLSVAENYMVVDCANTEFFMAYTGSHTLLSPYFYDNVARAHWCYFKSGSRRQLLESYGSYEDWPPLPGLSQDSNVNSEYFGTDLKSWTNSLSFYMAPDNPSTQDRIEGWGYTERISNYYNEVYTDLETPADHYEHMADYLENTEPASGSDLGNLYNLWAIPLSWHFYEWNQWLQARWPQSQQFFPNSDDEFYFPEGWKVKDEYNYGGANASVDCYIDAVNITPNMRISTDWIQWGASAKPFGYLENPNDPEVRWTPVYFGIVLPAFRDVRLIHNRLSTRPLGVKQVGWDEHIYVHLEKYMEQGVEGIEEFSSCHYCRQLKKWEQPGFRDSGVTWLEENQIYIDAGILCIPGPGGSSGGSG